MITNQKQLRRAFWQSHPNADRRTIPDYSGKARMHCTDTRSAWCDYLDAMQKSGSISPELAQRATLMPYKTLKVYEVQGDYGQGFECLCSSDNRREALRDLRAYRQNDTSARALRMVTKRERIEGASE